MYYPPQIGMLLAALIFLAVSGIYLLYCHYQNRLRSRVSLLVVEYYEYVVAHTGSNPDQFLEEKKQEVLSGNLSEKAFRQFIQRVAPNWKR